MPLQDQLLTVAIAASFINIMLLFLRP